MAILATQEETSLPSNQTSKRGRDAPMTRKAVRNNSGSLSDATTASTASSSSSSAGSEVSTKSAPRRKRTRGRGKKGRSSNNNNNNTTNSPKQHQQQQPPLSKQEQARYIAMDCEMVGVGPAGRTSVLARVSLVDWDGHVVLDEYVQPEAPVTDYRTYVSGITAQHLAESNATHTLATIRPVVAALLRDKILVGHSLKCDLQVLQLSHPWYDTRDTAKYEPFMQERFADGILWPRKLRDLCVSRQIMPADFQAGTHCSVLDAVAALRLYQTVRTKWEKVMDYKKNKTCQILQQQQQQQQQETSSLSSDDHSDDSSQSSY